MLAHQGVDGRVNCWMYAFLVPGTTPTAANAALSTAMVLVPNAADGWLAVDDEVVVYDVRAQACHVFEGVAALAWQCLDGDGSIDDILTDLPTFLRLISNSCNKISCRCSPTGSRKNSSWRTRMTEHWKTLPNPPNK